MEKWKTIAKYQGYEVSNKGNVRKKDDKYNLPTWITVTEGKKVLVFNRRTKFFDRVRVDRLVMDTFKPTNDGKEHRIIHIDGHIFNCDLNNLEYAD